MLEPQGIIRVVELCNTWGEGDDPRWLVFCGWFVGDWLSWQTPGALSPDLEDLL
jgi:hypothetical protein